MYHNPDAVINLELQRKYKFSSIYQSKINLKFINITSEMTLYQKEFNFCFVLIVNCSIKSHELIMITITINLSYWQQTDVNNNAHIGSNTFSYKSFLNPAKRMNLADSSLHFWKLMLITVLTSNNDDCFRRVSVIQYGILIIHEIAWSLLNLRKWNRRLAHLLRISFVKTERLNSGTLRMKKDLEFSCKCELFHDQTVESILNLSQSDDMLSTTITIHCMPKTNLSDSVSTSSNFPSL